MFQCAVTTADEEVGSSTRTLYLRGLAAGIAITLTSFGSIPATGPFHFVVSATEVSPRIFTREGDQLVGLREFALPVPPGNTIGGGVLVTPLDCGQAEDRFPEGNGGRPRLDRADWLLGRRNGRTGGR